MSWRGRLALTFLMVSVALGLGLAKFAGAAPLPPGNQLGPLASFRLPDGMPKSAGPSIIDATYRSMTGGSPAASNDSLFVIFSEPVSLGSIALSDFRFRNGGAPALTASNFVHSAPNVIALTGLSRAIAVGDSIYLAGAGVVTGTDASINADVSHIGVRSGPAITWVEYRPGTGSGTGVYDMRPSGDTLRVYLTHLYSSGVNTANPRDDFDMPEFGDNALNLTANAVAGRRFIDILFAGSDLPSGVAHGKIQALISRIKIKTTAGIAGNETGDAVTDNTSATFNPWHIVDALRAGGSATNLGPTIVAAGYNNRADGASANDVLTIVFDRDIDPSTVSNADFVLGAGATPTNPPTLGSNDGDNIITLGDFTGAAGPAGSTVTIGASAVSDFSGRGSVGNAVTIVASPIIVETRYNDGGDADPVNDLVEIFFDTPVIGSNCDTTTFSYFGFVSNGLIVTETADNDSLITLTGFSASNNWEQGDRLAIRAGGGLHQVQSVIGVAGGNNSTAVDVGNDASRIIKDFAQPRQIHFAQNLTYSRDTQGPISATADTAFVAVDERDTDDAAYFAMWVRKGSAVNLSYIQSTFNNATYIANPNPGTPGNDRNLIMTHDITPGSGQASDGQFIQTGDVINFAIYAVDRDGNVALNTTSNILVGSFISGPIPPPRDSDCVANVAVPGTTTDTDMIHITGQRNPLLYFAFGDAGSAIGADSIHVYDDFAMTTLLGAGPANKATGAWAKFAIGVPTGDYVYVTAIQVTGGTTSESSPTAIRHDRLLYDNMFAGSVRDPLNSLRRYTPGDTVHIVALVSDTTGDLSGNTPGPNGLTPKGGAGSAGSPFRSDLMAVSANFTGFSTRAGSDSVVFISLGANKNDEDNDWVDNGATAFNNAVLAANNVKDYPEPYVDENGNGQYDCGETFVDYSGSAYTAKIHDEGDSNLDSNDPNEHGWYYCEYWIDPNPATLVADPNGGDNFATLKDVNIPLEVSDNSITNQASLDLLSNELAGQANRTTMQFETDLNLAHNTGQAHLTAGGGNLFVATLDALAPTVSEITYLATANTLTQATSYPNGNLITPGNNVYELPSGVATPYVNLVDSTLSDDDVMFTAVQIDTTADTSSSQTEGGWRYLSLDPLGDRGSSAHNDGKPGIPLLDDDYDSTAAKTNGLDDDEDGKIDEDGEGVDFSDAQVTDAMQQPWQDANSKGPDGVYRRNDGIDNDNDAFFRYNPFTNEVIWFNVDESDSNNVDDDGDGLVDNATEQETYNAVFDNDEDGMQGGSVTPITLGASNRTIAQVTAGIAPGGTIYVKAFEDPAQVARYRGSKATKAATANGPLGGGITPGSWLTSYLDESTGGGTAAALFGGQLFSSNALGRDNLALVNRAHGARNIMSSITYVASTSLPVPYFGAVLFTGASSSAFQWDYRNLTGRNLDMNHIQKLYDLVDGSEYRIRAVAVDEAFNHNPAWAVPVRFNLDSTAPVVCIPPAHRSTTPGTGAAPEFNDFVDVRPGTPGLQVLDKGGHPGPYTLRADVVSGNDISEVHFQYWDATHVPPRWWDLQVPTQAGPANPDGSAPYTLFWKPPLLSNAPPALADTVFFRAYAVDNQGNTEAQFLLNDPPTLANGPQVTTCVDDGRLWELQVIVIDGTNPSSCVCQVGSDYNLKDGAQVPVEQAVDVSAWFTDNDGNPATNDVINVRFEYTPIGANTWTPFASLTGVPTSGELRDPSGIVHPVLVTGPDTLKTTVTWDTRSLAAGSYEIRAVATDIEGNSSVLTACVFTVTLDNSALRAYIQPVIPGVNSDTCGVAASDTLYAQVFIHDRSVSQVEFQYYADTNGDGIANDSGSWVSIFTQGDDASERKGDVTLRAGTLPFKTVDGSLRLQMNQLFNPNRVKFWDADRNGYSPIDPLIYDANDDGVFQDNTDFVGFVLYANGPGNGNPPEGAALANFPDNVYVNAPDFIFFPPATPNLPFFFGGTYIMEDNPLNTGAEQVDTWKAIWDVTGLNGKYLVRAVATDQLGNSDADLAGTPIPTSSIDIDSSLPRATVTSVTLQDGTSLAIPPQGQYISAANSYFYVNATTTDTDLKKVQFQWSRNGGVTWANLDVNDDQDSYSDLNMNWQFDAGIDEIFYDANGNGHYDAGDTILSKGSNGVLDTPTDPSNPYSVLYPLVTEDQNDGDDNDGDGKVDEDGDVAVSNLGGQSPADYFAPYSVPFNFHNLVFPTETNVLFRAVATDNNGNIDCNPPISSVVVGDNEAPKTDVVKAVVNGDTLDLETVLRGTLSPACFDSSNIGAMTLLVNVADQAQITSVDIYYRRDPNVYQSYNAWDTYLAWTPLGAADTAYPYEFTWNIQDLADGAYEFYARATDANGNVTMPPLHPYHFSIMRTTATVVSAVFLGSGLPATEVRPGDTVVLTATIDPAQTGAVEFEFAERIDNEVVRNISATYPFISANLQRDMVPSNGNGINEKVIVGGQPGIYVSPDKWATTTGKTARHYTVRNGGGQIEFGAAIASGTEVTVSYNVTSFEDVLSDNNETELDTDPPYTNEWKVPQVSSDNRGVVTSFDVMAYFSAEIVQGEGEGSFCSETEVSDGFTLRVLDTDIPQFTIYGIDDVNDNNAISVSADNWPGNALCVSRGLDSENDGIGAHINKLSGDWADFFLVSNELLANGDDDFATVVMDVTASGGFSKSCTFTKNPLQDDPPQDVHKVLYLSDFPTLDQSRVENVTISVDGFEDYPNTRIFTMYDDGATGGDLVAGDGHYTVTLSLPVGHNGDGRDYEYSYKIDLVGEDFITTDDPRSDDSFVRIPSLPYWFCSARRLDDDSLLKQNDVNHVVVTVTDTQGNIGTNISTVDGSLVNQGQIDVIVDRVAPTVAALSTDRPAVKVGGEVKVFATIVDPTPADVNIIAIPSVLFQVSPDAARKVWLNWNTDTDPSNGWGGVYSWGFNPVDDDIDNDGDGLFDEADEANFVYQIRAVPTDDCFNTGYSNLQAPAVVAQVTVDAQAPVCSLADPTNGAIFAHGSVITLTAAPSSDTDVKYVSFQYNVGNGWQAIDATPGNDLDDVDGLTGKQTPAFANGTGGYSVTWDTHFLTQADMYIRLRCVARDYAGNWSGNIGSPFAEPGAPVIEYITILLNDQTSPFAAINEVEGDGLAYVTKSVVDPTLAIKGQVILLGIASGYTAPNDITGDVATVVLQYSTDGTNWLDGGITNNLVGGGNLTDLQRRFAFVFDTRALGLPDGYVWVRAAAMDHDGNLQGDANRNGKLDNDETVPGAVRIRVDNTAPAMWVTKVGPVSGSPVADGTLIVADLWPSELARGGEYEVDQTYLRLSDNVTFRASGPTNGNSVDVINYTFLQFLDDWSDQEHAVWSPSFPTIPWMDADHNGTVDSGELSAWLANRTSYENAVSAFQSNNSAWMFSYRDKSSPGVTVPVGSPDGSWWLEYGSVANLKSNMGTDLPDKQYRFRAVTVDYAGNNNLDYQGHLLRIDSINPQIVEIYAGNNEIEAGGGGGTQVTQATVHVAGGDTVPLAAYVNDDFGLEEDKGQIVDKKRLGAEGFDPDLPGTESESSGIVGVRFDYMAGELSKGNVVQPKANLDAKAIQLSSGWTIIGLGTYDAAASLWKLDWTTPTNLSRTGPQAGSGSSTTDSLYAIRAVAVDSSGNYSSRVRSEAVAVQDITPPDDTEIVDINEDGGATYPPQTTEETVRSTRGTIVQGEVEILAATQAGDPSMLSDNSQVGDVFSPVVYFESRPKGGSTWTLIATVNDYSYFGSGAHQGPIWSGSWNTQQLNGSGARIWPDGQYDVRAWARDVWGNTELIEGAEAPMTVTVAVDNTPPTARVDAIASTPGRETEASKERNELAPYTFAVNTYNGETITTDEDVVVTYYYKLSTDLNVPASWSMVAPGHDASDQNPDSNRPYTFDWETWQIAGCGAGNLVPGQTYDIAATVTDLLGNTESMITMHDAGFSARLHVVDTRAPKATITELVRNVGNSTPVQFPNANVRIRSVSYIQAVVATQASGTGDDAARDAESVQFYYQPKAGQASPAAANWVLADGDIDEVGDQNWHLTNWDSSALPEGEYFFAAVATDCYGNRDANPNFVSITIDRTSPVYTGLNPENNESLVPDEAPDTVPPCSQPSTRTIDLIVRQTDGVNDTDYTTFSNNRFTFQYKRSSLADLNENWSNATSTELKDQGTGSPIQPSFSSAFNIKNLADGLYDFRVDAQDVAGNVTHQVFATKTIVDNTLPVVEISAISFPNRTDLTIQPVNGGVLPNISAGETVKLYVTATDDEASIPNVTDPTTGRDKDMTDVSEVQFFLTGGPSGNTTTPGGTYPQNLGTAGFDAARGQYYIVWNTTGLPDGNFSIVAMAEDVVRNVNCSQTVVGKVTNPAKPYAQVTAFNPDLLSEITKGTNSRVYGTTFGEKLASSVFFQYRAQKPGDATFAEWVNIGSALNTGETLSTRELGLLTQTLWMSNMRVSDMPNETNMQFRAVAVGATSDSVFAPGGTLTPASVTSREANYYGRSTSGRGLEPSDGTPGGGDFTGLYDLENTPILSMVKRTGATGQAKLDFVPNAANNLITGLKTEGVNFAANGLFTVTTSAPNVYPFVTMVAEDNAGNIDEALPEMNRRLDDSKVWTGEIGGDYTNFANVDPTEGARITMFASSHLKRTSTSGLAPQVDMKWHTWYIHQITPTQGSNGVAGIDGNGAKAADGYPTDQFAVEVPAGSAEQNAGMLLERVSRPVTDPTQDLYITAFGPTYMLRFLDSEWDNGVDEIGENGWHSKGWIRYDDRDPAIKAGTESQLTVAWYGGLSFDGGRPDGSSWRTDAISNVKVDTEKNVVTFNFEPEDVGTIGNDYVFSLITTDRFSPVQADAYPYWRGTTDMDPIFKVLLTNIHGGEIDLANIRVFVDGREVAATRGNGNNEGGSNFSKFLLYRNSWLDVSYVDGDQHRAAVTFGWPCDSSLGLTEGEHTMEVWFTNYDRSEYFGVDQPWTFRVDRTPVEITLNGGFVSDPKLNFAPAYVGAESNAITARLVDKGAGVLFREARIDDDDFSHWWWNDIEDECAIARYYLLHDEWFYTNSIPIQFDADDSFKYDLWRVNNPDHSNQPNAVHTEEERTLLHTGTADEVWPNVTTSASGDTMWVPLYILGGGQIADGNVLELTLYSKRYETQPINFLNENLDAILGLGGNYGRDGWWIDFSTKRFIQYASGIQDHVHNAGSRFVEQRYIVDKSSPTIDVTSPGVSCDGGSVTNPIEPGVDYTFTADLSDGTYGSGVKASTVVVNISGPTNSSGVIPIANKEVTATHVKFTMLKPILVGQYNVRITGEDNLGNKFDKTCVIFVGSSVLTLSQVTAYPNPFNPREADMSFSFINDRTADVTITVYDFNGDKVKTIRPGNLSVGTQVIKWGGDAEDGTPLANGVYLARIEANDGRRTQTQTIKVALWRD